MRNWKFLLNIVLLSAGVIWFSSCDSEDDDLPDVPIIGNIDVNPADDAIDGVIDNNIVVNSGENVTFTVDVTVAGGFNTARLLWATDAAATPVEVDVVNRNDMGVTAGTVTVNDIILTLTNVTESGFATIEIVDDAGQSSFVDYTIEVLDTETYQAVLIGGFLNANEGSFYNAVDNVVYKYQGAKDNDEKVDLLFYYATTTTNSPNYTIAAPDSPEAQTTWTSQQSTLTWPLAVENSTRFKPLGSTFDFDNTNTATQIENAYPETGADETRITNLQAGQMVAFKLDADRGAKYGVFRVESTAGTSGADRAITLTVKIQR